jgi:predicted Zn finger-like uncharacterized protein
MSTVRLRRLQADYENLKNYVRRHPRLALVAVEGDPPEKYQLEYLVRSLRQVDDKMQVVKSHQVEIALPRNYPRTPPHCRMLTPVFHPNIAPHAICVGDHWSAGEPLWSIVARIGEMLSFQSYNTKSPLNGEAARWVEENQDRLPLDPVSMLVDEPRPAAKPKRPQAVSRPAPAGRSAATAARSPAAAAPPKREGTILVTCPNCSAAYRIPLPLTAKRARCKRCQTLIELPAKE